MRVGWGRACILGKPERDRMLGEIYEKLCKVVQTIRSLNSLSTLLSIKVENLGRFE